jgi:vacuolar-type H+-ATPase subunit H
MRDVIKSVIATEGEAKAIVAAAWVEAHRIASEAQKESHDLVARARQEARVEAERIVEAAVNAAGREKQEGLARVAVEIEAQLQLEEAAHQRAVAAAVRCVCGRWQN